MVVRYHGKGTGNLFHKRCILVCKTREKLRVIDTAREYKQRKTEYQQILSEFDRLGIPCSYYTIELSVLGHYLPPSCLEINVMAAKHLFAQLTDECCLNISVKF